MLYYSRSGSTFLSSRLDRYEDIGVTVESNFMRTLILKKKDLQRAASTREVYDLVMGDRVGNLGVSYEEFSRRLGPGTRHSIGEVARALLSAYFAKEKPNSKVWVVKDGANGLWVNQISRELPDARFIHVVRDGRAVLNSGLNNVRPYGKGERMARDPATAARTWTQLVDRVDAFSTREPGRCLECRYEDLMADEEGQIARIRSFLGLESAGMKSDGSYYDRIPDREKAIHQLVSGAPVSERAEAWREELGRGDLLVFQLRAARTLVRHGYEVPQGVSLVRLLSDREFVATYLKSLALRVRDWVSLVSDRRKLRRIVDTRLLSWRDR